MISDTLSEAHDDLRHYLDDPTYEAIYAGVMRDRIEALLIEMGSIRAELDRQSI